MTDEVKVEQVDREAAAAFYGKYLARPGEVPVEAAFRMGHVDQSPLIQAFARHRLAARPAPAEDAVERVARAISDANWKPDASKEFLDEQFNDDVMHALFVKQARAALAAMQPRGEQQAGRDG